MTGEKLDMSNDHNITRSKTSPPVIRILNPNNAVRMNVISVRTVSKKNKIKLWQGSCKVTQYQRRACISNARRKGRDTKPMWTSLYAHWRNSHIWARYRLNVAPVSRNNILVHGDHMLRKILNESCQWTEYLIRVQKKMTPNMFSGGSTNRWTYSRFDQNLEILINSMMPPHIGTHKEKENLRNMSTDEEVYQQQKVSRLSSIVFSGLESHQQVGDLLHRVSPFFLKSHRISLDDSQSPRWTYPRGDENCKSTKRTLRKG